MGSHQVAQARGAVQVNAVATSFSHDARRCPKCDSDRVSAVGRANVVCGSTYQQMHCQKCNERFETRRSMPVMAWSP